LNRSPTEGTPVLSLSTGGVARKEWAVIGSAHRAEKIGSIFPGCKHTSLAFLQRVAVTLTPMHAMHMRAVEHTNRRGLRTHHAAWVNNTGNRCSKCVPGKSTLPSVAPTTHFTSVSYSKSKVIVASQESKTGVVGKRGTVSRGGLRRSAPTGVEPSG
jgi:hypothetical protein